MVRIHTSVEINAPLTQVYAYLSNPQHELEWMVGMQDLHNLSGSGIGMHFERTYRIGGITFRGESTCVEDDGEKHLVLKSKGSMESTRTINLERRTDTITVLRLDIEYSLTVPILGRLAEIVLAKRYRHNTELSLLNIKQRIESHALAWKGTERRRYDRKKADLLSYVEGLSHGQETNAEAKITNLSPKGMFIETDTPLDEGTDTVITAIQFGETFWVMGKVLRSTRKGVAVGFEQDPPREITGILNSGRK